jgi:hypothetical protein
MIALLSLVVLITAYLLVRQFGDSNLLTSARRNDNAKVLNQAKQALIGYAVQQASQPDESNPGRLPCPEPAGNFGTVNEGIAAGSCTLPAVGRLPWRTLGIDKLADAASEPLWYVVSNGWALPSSSATLTINSNTQGQLTVDGAANDSVALIIAPGPAFTAPATPGCAAWTQTRPTSGAPDLRNYLECDNATSPADASFVTTGPGGSFNDQVLRVTTSDLLPEIEAAIAMRIQREIVPVLKGVYASSQWGLSTMNPLFPFAAPFTNPGTADYRGGAGTFQGLLPFSYSQACNPLTDPRCSTTFVNWNTAVVPTVTATNGIIIGTPTCTVSATVARCDGTYAGFVGQTVQLQMTARANNVAMTLRSIDPTQTAVRYGQSFLGPSSPGAETGTFNSDGSANMVTTGAVPGFDNVAPLNVSVLFRITANIGMLTDHWLLSAADPPPSNSPSTCPTTTPSPPNYWCTGWFVRNEWYRLVYYAAAQGNTVGGLPTPACTTGIDCLSVANVTPAGKQRAILILAGRSLNNSPRPNGNLADFLEFGNADGNTIFEQQPISRVLNTALKAPFNDRVVVLDANP